MPGNIFGGCPVTDPERNRNPRRPDREQTCVATHRRIPAWTPPWLRQMHPYPGQPKHIGRNSKNRFPKDDGGSVQAVRKCGWFRI